MITVICPTYSRVHLLEELIACFLAQTVDDAELLILNDHPEQTIVFDHPRVRVINYKARFEHVWQKMRDGIPQAQGDWLTFWDDDDIFLPNHLETLLALIPVFHGEQCVRQYHEWVDNGHRFYRYAPSQPTHCLMVKTDLFAAMGGWPQTDHNADFEIVRALLVDKHLIGPPSMVEPPTVIYRLATGCAHMCEVDQENICPSMAADADARNIPTGTLTLNPGLNEDYAVKAAASWKAFHG